MAKAPWRCSQCGTVNEPVANSCRTCGRWPSLFDLQDSAVGDLEQDDPAADGVAGFELDESPAEGIEPELVELAPEATTAAPTDAGGEPAGRSPEPGRRRPVRGRRQLFRLVIPIGVVLYFAITSYLNR